MNPKTARQGVGCRRVDRRRAFPAVPKPLARHLVQAHALGPILQRVGGGPARRGAARLRASLGATMHLWSWRDASSFFLVGAAFVGWPAAFRGPAATLHATTAYIDSVTRLSRHDECRATLRDQTPLMLVGGEWLWVAADDIAADSSGRIAVVGPSVAVWKRDLSRDPGLSHADSLRALRSGIAFTNHQPAPVSDSLVGAVFRLHGRARPIPFPGELQRKALEAAYVAAGKSGTWRMLFVVRRAGGVSTAHGTLTERMTEMQTGIAAELWYGVYDGRQWRFIEKIADADHGDFNVRDAVGIAVNGGDLAFAYPVLGDAHQRVVLLHSQDGRWSADTLWVHADIQSVQVLSSPSQHQWLVAVSHLQVSHPGASALYLSEFDSSWTPEMLVVTAPIARGTGPKTLRATTGIVSPSVLSAPNGWFATWMVPESGPGDANGMIRAARGAWSSPATLQPPLAVVGAADIAVGYSAIALQDSSILWAATPPDLPEWTEFVMLRHGVLSSLGLLPVDAKFGHVLTPLPNGDVLAISALQRFTQDDPPMVSVENHISISCK